MNTKTIFLATRGSALALAQSNLVLAQCRGAFPELSFELKIIKTTGDKLQTISLTTPSEPLPKGLFTKELEVALLSGEADFAVHSLKDLPTELPDGLTLGAVGKREDVRDVLIYRDAEFLAKGGTEAKRGLPPKSDLYKFPIGATIATSSTRRQAQLLALRPDLKTVPIRGNVGTRLQKLADLAELDGVILASAGLKRLHFNIDLNGRLSGKGVPEGLIAAYLSPEEMLPCVGQAALGIEVRQDDERIAQVCRHLNDVDTQRCTEAERAFLLAMGGGCLSPVAAYADTTADQIRIRAVSFRDGSVRRGQRHGPASEAVALGKQIARDLQ